MKLTSITRAPRRVRKTRVLAACAAVSAIAFQAQAHTIVGDRVFPATLTIDDPGVNDELALPSLLLHAIGKSRRFARLVQLFAGLELREDDHRRSRRPDRQRTSTGRRTPAPRAGPTSRPNSNICLGRTPNPKRSCRWPSITTGPIPAARKAPRCRPVPFSTLTFNWSMAARAFGDVQADWVKPFALTGEFTTNFPTTATNADGSLNPTTISYGARLQYSLLYMNSHVAGECRSCSGNLIPTFEANSRRRSAIFRPTCAGKFSDQCHDRRRRPVALLHREIFRSRRDGPGADQQGKRRSFRRARDRRYLPRRSRARIRIGKPLFGPPQARGHIEEENS